MYPVKFEFAKVPDVLAGERQSRPCAPTVCRFVPDLVVASDDDVNGRSDHESLRLTCACQLPGRERRFTQSLVTLSFADGGGAYAQVDVAFFTDVLLHTTDKLKRWLYGEYRSPPPWHMVARGDDGDLAQVVVSFKPQLIVLSVVGMVPKVVVVRGNDRPRYNGQEMHCVVPMDAATTLFVLQAIGSGRALHGALLSNGRKWELLEVTEFNTVPGGRVSGCWPVSTTEILLTAVIGGRQAVVAHVPLQLAKVDGASAEGDARATVITGAVPSAISVEGSAVPGAPAAVELRSTFGGLVSATWLAQVLVVQVDYVREPDRYCSAFYMARDVVSVADLLDVPVSGQLVTVHVGGDGDDDNDSTLTEFTPARRGGLPCVPTSCELLSALTSRTDLHLSCSCYGGDEDPTWHQVLMEVGGGAEAVLRVRMLEAARADAVPESDTDRKWLFLHSSAASTLQYVVRAIAPVLEAVPAAATRSNGGRLIRMDASSTTTHRLLLPHGFARRSRLKRSGPTQSGDCAVDIGNRQVLLLLHNVGDSGPAVIDGRNVDSVGAVVLDTRTWRTTAWSAFSPIVNLQPAIVTSCSLWNATTLLLSVSRRPGRPTLALVPLRGPWLQPMKPLAFDRILLYSGHKMGFYQIRDLTMHMSRRGLPFVFGGAASEHEFAGLLDDLHAQGERVGVVVQLRDPRAAIASAIAYHVDNCAEFGGVLIGKLFPRLCGQKSDSETSSSISSSRVPDGDFVEGMLHSMRRHTLMSCCREEAFAWHAAFVANRSSTCVNTRVCDFLAALPFESQARLFARFELDARHAMYAPLRARVSALQREARRAEAPRSSVLVVKYEDANNVERIDDYVQQIAEFVQLPPGACEALRRFLRANVAKVKEAAEHGQDEHIRVGVHEDGEVRWADMYARLASAPGALDRFRRYVREIGLAETMEFFGYDASEFLNS